MLRLSEKYFDMNRKQCKQGLAHYKKFIVRMDGVSKFLKVAEVKGPSQAVSSSTVDVVVDSLPASGHLVFFCCCLSTGEWNSTICFSFSWLATHFWPIMLPRFWICLYFGNCGILPHLAIIRKCVY